MAITQERAEDSRRNEPAPCQTASIVSCTISSREHPLAGDQQNLGERDPAVLGVERGHRVLVAQPDPAQQLQVGSGPVPGAGARFTGVCCAGLC
jgi:hypothetical protein